MHKLPPQHWQYNGQTLTVSRFVEGSTIVRMTPVTTTGGIIVPPKQYLGDHVANGLSRMGVPTCPGCTKRKKWLNNAHERFQQMVNRTTKIRPDNTWNNGHHTVSGDG